ncbi:MAG: DUF5790 family protein [Halobacteria archaeon]|nr:DUF5790 family protein [Halobacteria archaeon]
MAQSTFDDEDLFTEASDEIKDDVTEALEEAEENLPDADDIMEVEGDNIIGILNSLKSGLDTEDAADSYREAKKWFEMGKRADAFEDDEEFEDDAQERLDNVKEAIEAIQTAEESATDLTDSVASLKRLL